MVRKLTFLALFLLIAAPVTVFAAGDYIWEEKFSTALPKAESGDLDAQFELAGMYERGRGTTKDEKLSFEWYKKAAEQKHVKSAYKLGYAYLKGNGTSKDFEEAYRWLKFASDQGYERAHFYLAEMMELGNGIDVDLQDALAMYQQAADAGFKPAEARVARVKEAQAEMQRTVARNKRTRETRREAAAQAQLDEKKATPVSMKSPPPTTRELILQGGWKNRETPTEYLPSEATDCKSTGRTIECESKPQRRNIGVADVIYTTKAVLFAIKPTGSFKVSYRNRVLDVQITDPEFAESGAQVPVKKGWQDAEHSLKCDFNGENELSCNKNKSRNVTIHR